MQQPALFQQVSQLLSGRRKRTLILVLNAPLPQPRSEVTKFSGLADKWRRWLTHLAQPVQQLDQDYQQFVQTSINPLFSRIRDDQQRLLNNNEATPMSPKEQAINRYLGGTTALFGLALASQLLLPLLALPVVATGVILSIPFYREAYRQWRQHRRIRLIHLGIPVNLAFWFGGYYAWGVFNQVVWQLTQKIMVMAQEQSHTHQINILRLQPNKVWVRANGVEVETPFDQVQVGDTLILSAGQIIPIDGTVILGAAAVDQHMLTGESQPVEKTAGDKVLAATVVLAGMIDVRVEQTQEQTLAAQIGQMLNRVMGHHLRYQADLLEQSQKYVLPMLGVSVISLPFFGPASAAALLAANQMPQLIGFAPGALWGFLNLASQGGVLVKDAQVLLQLPTVDTIVFDKTGTLTQDQLQLVELYSFADWAQEEVLRLAAAAELRQTHPIAHAILNAAHERHLALPSIQQAQYEAGFGLKVWLAASNQEPMLPWEPNQAGQAEAQMASAEGASEAQRQRPLSLVRVGSVRFMTMEGVVLSDAVQSILAESQERGHSLVLVAVDDQLAGCIELAPKVRSEAKSIIDQLRQRGLALYIISGDQEAPTRQLAETLGMTGYFANTLPTQKAELVEKLQQEGRKVCFVGDGINDTIAMRKALVSISLRGATTAATDTAQAVLMDGNLTHLISLIELSEQFQRTMQRLTRSFATLSLFTISGLLFFHFTFGAAMLLYNLGFFTGFGITLYPIYDNPMLSADSKELS